MLENPAGDQAPDPSDDRLGKRSADAAATVTPDIHSAVQTVTCELNGLQQLRDALAGPLGAAFSAAVQGTCERKGPHPGPRRRQEWPHRAQDCRHLRLHRQARPLSAPVRRQPRRPGHRAARGRRLRAVVVGGVGRTGRPARLHPPLSRAADRRHRLPGVDAWARCRPYVSAAELRRGHARTRLRPPPAPPCSWRSATLWP